MVDSFFSDSARWKLTSTKDVFSKIKTLICYSNLKLPVNAFHNNACLFFLLGNFYLPYSRESSLVGNGLMG